MMDARAASEDVGARPFVDGDELASGVADRDVVIRAVGTNTSVT
jgi:hypothetical protein